MDLADAPLLCAYLPPVNTQAGAPLESQGWPEGCTDHALDTVLHLAVVPCSQSREPRLSVVGQQGSATAAYWLRELKGPLQALGRYDRQFKDKTLLLSRVEGSAIVYRLKLETSDSEVAITNDVLAKCHGASGLKLDAGWLLFTITYGTCFLQPSVMSQYTEVPASLQVFNPFCIDISTVDGHELNRSVEQFRLTLSRLFAAQRASDSWLEDSIGAATPHPLRYSTARGELPVEPDNLPAFIRLRLPRLLTALGCGNVSCGHGISKATETMTEHGWLKVEAEGRTDAQELLEEIRLLGHELVKNEKPTVSVERTAQLHVMRRMSLCVYLHAIMNAIPLGASIEQRFPPSTPPPSSVASQFTHTPWVLAPAKPQASVSTRAADVASLGPPGKKTPLRFAPWIRAMYRPRK